MTAVDGERLTEVQKITKGQRTQAVGDLGLAPGVLAGVIRNSFSDRRGFRAGLLRSLWVEAKRFGARNVRTIELSRVRGIDQIYVDGPVIRHGMLVLSALAALLECESIFEFGSVDALTPALLAHNLATARIYTFDRPDETRSWPRASRDSPDPKITRLSGDSASYDFSPYSGKVDLVHIDGSNRPTSLAADTEAAFGMLSELGSIVWYGFTYHPALYAFLERLAPSLDRPIHHLAGTRLALYSRWDVVVPDE
jgi:predicted O-methyltransferase YrrM